MLNRHSIGQCEGTQSGDVQAGVAVSKWPAIALAEKLFEGEVHAGYRYLRSSYAGDPKQLEHLYSIGYAKTVITV